jgi:hypothetical protein
VNGRPVVDDSDVRQSDALGDFSALTDARQFQDDALASVAELRGGVECERGADGEVSEAHVQDSHQTRRLAPGVTAN